MNDYSLIDKFKVLMNMIASSPLFLFCSMIGVCILILYIIQLKEDKKVNKWIYIGIWSALFVVLIINYNSVMINLLDNLFDAIFNALYFPNLVVYVVILAISNIVLIYSLISKKTDKKNKVINFFEALVIDILLFLIIDIVKTNNINVYDELTIYSNSNLLILLELTSAIFTSWILINLMLRAHKKLKKYDSSKYSNRPEIVFEDV